MLQCCNFVAYNFYADLVNKGRQTSCEWSCRTWISQLCVRLGHIEVTLGRYRDHQGLPSLRRQRSLRLSANSWQWWAIDRGKDSFVWWCEPRTLWVDILTQWAVHRLLGSSDWTVHPSFGIFDARPQLLRWCDCWWHTDAYYWTIELTSRGESWHGPSSWIPRWLHCPHNHQYHNSLSGKEQERSI